MNKSTTINFLKVFATYLVFSQHSTIVTNQELGFQLQGFIQQLLNTPAQGGVWMFLIISGLLASLGFDKGKYQLNLHGILSYYKNRFVKILLPTWIFISLAWMICGTYSFKLIELIQLLTCTYNGNGIGIPGVGATWYIFIVMWLYILTPFSLKFFRRLEKKYAGKEKKMYIILIAILFVYGITYRCGCEVLHLSKYNWRYANILACGDCFFIGVITSQLQKYVDFSKYGKNYMNLAYIFLLIVVLMCTFKNYSTLLKAFHALISPSLYAIVCAAIISLSNATTTTTRFGKLCTMLSPYTFAFYLWHTLVMIYLCRNLQLDSGFSSYSIVAGIGFIITCYLAYLTTNMNNSIIVKLLK